MTTFTFDKALFVINGPLQVRIYNILSAILVAKAYNADFKILWEKEENFDYELDDIFQTVCFENNVTTSIDIVKDTSYYYNPLIQIDKFLTACVANGLEERFEGKEFTKLDWVVFDNLNGHKVKMIPQNILSDRAYLVHLNEIQKSLLYSIQIDGYINLFQNIQKEQDMICIYINIDDNIDEYFEFMDNIKNQIFVIFHWNFSKDIKDSIEKTIRDRYIGKCLFVVHETHGKIIEYMCIKHCKIMTTLNSFDDYIHSAVGDHTILYTFKKKAASNLDITCLQMLM